jgi:fatty acid desaturase
MFHPFYTTAADGARYQRTVLILTALAFGQLALATFQLIPFWVMALTMPVIVPRWMLAVHELFHVRKSEQVNFIVQLLPMVFTPFPLGYKQYQEIHAGHHRFMCSKDDPEFFQLRGGYLTGLFNASTVPEQAVIRWVTKHGVDSQLVVTMLLNATLFVACVNFAGWNFLWFWIPVRISYGLSNFAFFYALHRRGSSYGVYSVQLPKFVKQLYMLILGYDALLATCYHDLHHHNPRIAAYALDEASKMMLNSTSKHC